jgi:hypothetical protein
MSTFPDGVYQYGGVPVGSGVGRLADIFEGGNIWFVDYDNGSAAYTGKKPDWAFDLPSTAVSAASKGAVIYIRPRTTAACAQTYYVDNIDIPVTKPNLTICGAGAGNPNNRGSVQLKPSTLTSHTIDVKASGCTFENMRLTATGGTAGSGVAILHAVRAKTGGDIYHGYSGLTVRNCLFQNTVAHAGYGLGASPYENDVFGGAIALGTPQHCLIEGNVFDQCLGGITIYPTNGDIINVRVLHNYFQGYAAAAGNRDVDILLVLNSVTSNSVIIDSNVFADGVPSHTGGAYGRFIYMPLMTAGTGIWSNNVFAIHSAEAEMSENGSACQIADEFLGAHNYCEGTGSSTLGLVAN